MSTDLRDAFHRAADAVPVMGDVERAVRSGRRRRRAATVAAPLAVLALVGGVWLVAAGGLSGDEPPVADSAPSGVTAAELDERVFVSSGEVEGLTPGRSIVVSFTDNHLDASTGCVVAAGTWQLQGAVLEVTGYRQSSRCRYGAGEEDDVLLTRLLTSRPALTLDGDELTLSSPERTVTMTESAVEADVAEADATLTDRTWGLQSIADGREFLALPEGVQSTLEFSDGALTVDYGCNTGGGDVTVTDSTIEIGSISTTQIGCPSPFLSVERAVQQVLFDDGPLAYVVEGDLLTITSNGDELVYRAAS